MSEFKWEVGKRYRTRDGKDVIMAHILNTDGVTTENLVFLVNPDDDPEVELYYNSGCYYRNDQSDNDIESDWAPPETIEFHGRTYKLADE